MCEPELRPGRATTHNSRPSKRKLKKRPSTTKPSVASRLRPFLPAPPAHQARADGQIRSDPATTPHEQRYQGSSQDTRPQLPNCPRPRPACAGFVGHLRTRSSRRPPATRSALQGSNGPSPTKGFTIYINFLSSLDGSSTLGLCVPVANQRELHIRGVPILTLCGGRGATNVDAGRPRPRTRLASSTAAGLPRRDRSVGMTASIFAAG